MHRDPTYHDLGDHTEAFALDFDPEVMSYDELLELFWSSHRPNRPGYGRQYMAAAFPSAAQLDRALASRDRIASKLGTEVATPIVPDARFYLAEDYHQKYQLRHEPVLMAELAHYSPGELVDSTVAARLNSYAAGHGRPELFEAELDAMKLSRAAVDLARARFRNR